MKPAEVKPLRLAAPEVRPAVVVISERDLRGAYAHPCANPFACPVCSRGRTAPIEPGKFGIQDPSPFF